jgi:hypothetical protein
MKSVLPDSGSAAMFATTLLALGLVLALRPDRGGNGKPSGAQ